jgi:hypothetical protein
MQIPAWLAKELKKVAGPPAQKDNQRLVLKSENGK